MPRVSRVHLSGDAEDKIKNIFLNELVRIMDEKNMASLLDRLLTEQEKIMLAKRLVAFVMIDQGVPNVKISRSLHLTTETVIRFRLIYTIAKEKKEPVVGIVKNITVREELRILFKDILKGYVIPAFFGKIPK